MNAHKMIFVKLILEFWIDFSINKQKIITYINKYKFEKETTRRICMLWMKKQKYEEIESIEDKEEIKQQQQKPQIACKIKSWY